MPFIHTLSAAQATGEVQAMYQRQADAFGYLPNYARVFCHRPELMKLWADLQKGIRRHVEPRRFELVTLAAAHALRSSYCSLAHGQKLTEYFTADEVCAIVRDADAGLLSEADRAIVRYARKVAVDASTVTEEDVAELERQGLDDGEIFDIAATAAARAFFTKVVDGLGARPDAAFLELDAGFREVMTVGREIEADAARG